MHKVLKSTNKFVVEEISDNKNPGGNLIMKSIKSKKMCSFILALMLALNFCFFTTVQAASGQDIVNYAKQFIGVPYVWGGSSPSGFDCSGLVQYVYKHFGINLPRTTSGQITAGVAVSRNSLQLGDLIFPSTGHVAIYVGNGQMIHAPQPGEKVKITSIYAFYTARRILTDSPNDQGVDGIIFDHVFYSDKYPDLKKAFGYDYNSLYNHWQQYGKAEGRAPSHAFDPVYYVNAYSDLKKTFGTDYRAAYNHFVTFGCNENRKSSPVFDIAYYKKVNPDLKVLSTNFDVVNHFKIYGMKEGRATSENFNVRTYYARYEDLRKAFGNNYRSYFDHYLFIGIQEGRKAN